MSLFVEQITPPDVSTLRRSALWVPHPAPPEVTETMPTPLPPGLLEAAQDVGRDWIQAAYFAEAESAAETQWQRIILPFLQIEATGIDLSVTMDLAAGHGRNSVRLLPMAGTLHIVDIHASNVEICRR